MKGNHISYSETWIDESDNDWALANIMRVIKAIYRFFFFTVLVEMLGLTCQRFVVGLSRVVLCSLMMLEILFEASQQPRRWELCAQ